MEVVSMCVCVCVCVTVMVVVAVVRERGYHDEPWCRRGGHLELPRCRWLVRQLGPHEVVRLSWVQQRPDDEAARSRRTRVQEGE
jgi:hypothetical protein